MSAVPSSWRDLVNWQRLVAAPLNRLTQGYLFPSWDAEPADTNEGYTFYDTANHVPKWFDGTKYNAFGKAILEGLGDPGADSVVIWDDSESEFAFQPLGADGWTQIATSSPTGVSQVSFTSIPTTYTNLLLIWSGLSHNSGTSQYPALAVSPNGSTYSSNAAMGEINNASEASRGATFIPNYNAPIGVLMTALTNDTATTNIDYTNLGWNLAWRVNGSGINALRCSWSSGANFDAGTLTLYGQ